MKLSSLTSRGNLDLKTINMVPEKQLKRLFRLSLIISSVALCTSVIALTLIINQMIEAQDLRSTITAMSFTATAKQEFNATAAATDALTTEIAATPTLFVANGACTGTAISNNIPVRENTNNEAAQLGVLQSGIPVVVTGIDNTSNWYELYSYIHSGWVFKIFVTLDNTECEDKLPIVAR